jgi:hypothetical protein
VLTNNTKRALTGAHGGSRTHNTRLLKPMPLPVGLHGRNGADYRDRTDDPILTMDVLYQLS